MAGLTCFVDFEAFDWHNPVRAMRNLAAAILKRPAPNTEGPFHLDAIAFQHKEQIFSVPAGFDDSSDYNLQYLEFSTATPVAWPALKGQPLPVLNSQVLRKKGNMGIQHDLTYNIADILPPKRNYLLDNGRLCVLRIT